MILICPHCKIPGEIPDIFRRFYRMPVACHSCSRLHFVEREACPGKAVSITKSNHEISCANCGRRLMVPGKPPVTPLAKLSCPSCNQPATNSRAQAVVSAFVLWGAAFFFWMIIIIGILHLTGIISLKDIAFRGLAFIDQLSMLVAEHRSIWHP